jgi:hypothetical protein
MGKLEAYRYEKGEDLAVCPQERTENFEYEAMCKRLEELSNNPQQEAL